MIGDLDARELFHLLFLERRLGRSKPGLYVLKGGVNLRFFHQSPRYSEDLDLDVRPGRVAVETLRKKGYRLLQDAAFRRVLAATSSCLRANVSPPRSSSRAVVWAKVR